MTDIIEPRKSDNPNNPEPEEFVIYPQQITRVVENVRVVGVSPELLLKLHSQLPPGYHEGIIRLEVKYEDLVALITATGSTVRQMGFDGEPWDGADKPVPEEVAQ